MILVLCGIALAFNIVIILVKVRHQKYYDAVLDFTCLAIITITFSGSFSALATGTVGSAFLSMYLWFKPLQKKEKAQSLRTSKYALKVKP